MPLSWNEIRDRAIAFSREFAHDTREHAEDRSFWDGFFNVFGVSRKRLASFQEPVKKLGGAQGFIDLFWKGELIVEHKSLGKSLDKAYSQALDYFAGLKERDLPKRVLVSDFARIRLYVLETGEHHEFALEDLHKNVGLFAFIAGYTTQRLASEDPVNQKAAERMGRLHDALKASGYEGHDLEVLLVRLLFCLFAEDTGIFQPRGCFRDYIDQRTSEDGSDLGPLLARLFQVLNQPEGKRPKTLDEQLAAFPYVNGKLFEENLSIADFNRDMREALLDACALDWSQISPAIFGALFQSIMDARARRNLGAHYTSEANIQKLIRPLFLDELHAEFDQVKAHKAKLTAFHEKLRGLTFFDPACGCGNFLVVTYRELRELELKVLRALRAGDKQRVLDTEELIRVDVDQFYGIEIEEFPAQIAQVALWLTDHQMNLKVSAEFGQYFARIPLKTSPRIINDNALQLDWGSVLPAKNCSYILGNPPFLGKQNQSAAQKDDVVLVYGTAKGGKELDFVAAWYVKAARYAAGHTRCAFVATNSIVQGEQVGLLWRQLKPTGVRIQFAHRTFRWSNDARGVAAVHCVIIGFAKYEAPKPVIYDYEDIQGEPHALQARVINPYLIDGPDIWLDSRRKPVCNVPLISFGSMPNDGGHLLLEDDEKKALLTEEPELAPWVKRFVGAHEYLNGGLRWCLWLKGIPPSLVRTSAALRSRIEAVRCYRMASTRQATKKLAATPALFGEVRQPIKEYVLVPRHSSERRTYIPMSFVDPEIICGDANLLIADATKYHLGVLSSAMHMAWVRTVCGRIKSDFRYTNEIVYNNFPWPIDATQVHRDAISKAADDVLKVRATHNKSTLSDLYDPISIPAELVQAHRQLDRAVDNAYTASGGKKTWATDAERAAFLFEQYQKLTSLLPTAPAVKKRAARKTAAGAVTS